MSDDLPEPDPSGPENSSAKSLSPFGNLLATGKDFFWSRLRKYFSLWGSLLAGYGILGLAAGKIGMEMPPLLLWIIVVAGAFLIGFFLWTAVKMLGFKWIGPEFPRLGRIVAGSKLPIGLLGFSGVIAYFWNPMHEKFKASPEVGLPVVELQTLKSLGLPAPGATITTEMAEHFRDSRLTIRNTNSVSLDRISARVQLPEPALENGLKEMQKASIQAPAGVNVKWAPEIERPVVLGTATSIGPPPPRPNWLLDIDRIPALSSITIPLVTVPETLVFPVEFGISTNTLGHYLMGQYCFRVSGHEKTQVFLTPIIFDKTNRMMSVLKTENTATNWRVMKAY